MKSEDEKIYVKPFIQKMEDIKAAPQDYAHQNLLIEFEKDYESIHNSFLSLLRFETDFEKHDMESQYSQKKSVSVIDVIEYVRKENSNIDRQYVKSLLKLCKFDYKRVIFEFYYDKEQKAVYIVNAPSLIHLILNDSYYQSEKKDAWDTWCGVTFLGKTQQTDLEIGMYAYDDQEYWISPLYYRIAQYIKSLLDHDIPRKDPIRFVGQYNSGSIAQLLAFFYKTENYMTEALTTNAIPFASPSFAKLFHEVVEKENILDFRYTNLLRNRFCVLIDNLSWICSFYKQEYQQCGYVLLMPMEFFCNPRYGGANFFSGYTSIAKNPFTLHNHIVKGDDFVRNSKGGVVYAASLFETQTLKGFTKYWNCHLIPNMIR